ncbi:hypothetical protein TYRP_021438 [Tyrophagus putrescentiae]|nr:hypothetical protein TYRP_021438 [Tyrophagus putrescentiae]
MIPFSTSFLYRQHQHCDCLSYKGTLTSLHFALCLPTGAKGLVVMVVVRRSRRQRLPALLCSAQASSTNA